MSFIVQEDGDDRRFSGQVSVVEVDDLDTVEVNGEDRSVLGLRVVAEDFRPESDAADEDGMVSEYADLSLWGNRAEGLENQLEPGVDMTLVEARLEEDTYGENNEKTNYQLKQDEKTRLDVASKGLASVNADQSQNQESGNEAEETNEEAATTSNSPF